MEILEREAVIAGTGMSTIGRRTGIAALDLTLDAAGRAIADAGMVPADIDGVATLGDTPIDEAARALGMEPPAWRGGGFDTAGLLSPLFSAFWAVGTGAARNVLVYRTVNMMGGSVLPDPTAAEADNPMMTEALSWVGPLLAMHAYAAPNWLAMHCRRHMHLYGTTKEQLGWLAINSRANAAHNPAAAFRDPITMDDYLAARPVSDPFGLLDCDVPVDGSIAFVITGADRAADLPNPAVRIDAIGGSSGAGGWDQRPDYPRMASADAAAELWNRSSLTPSDVDVAELYDGFTFLTIAWLEALGFCGEGEGGPFVEGASRIALDGELPLNTYGGQLSAGRMHGYWVIHEAVQQLRGLGGARQVDGAEVAVAAAGGGPIAGAVLLTR